MGIPRLLPKGSGPGGTTAYRPDLLFINAGLAAAHPRNTAALSRPGRDPSSNAVPRCRINEAAAGGPPSGSALPPGRRRVLLFGGWYEEDDGENGGGPGRHGDAGVVDPAAGAGVQGRPAGSPDLRPGQERGPDGRQGLDGRDRGDAGERDGQDL